MLEGKAVISDTDMLQTMQQDAIRLAAKALDIFDVIDTTEIACCVKKILVRSSPISTAASSTSVLAALRSCSLKVQRVQSWRPVDLHHWTQ
uniref:Dynein light chain n=1 Tax=Nelumbo nucifera TaxID=4432 RepID=A0A822XN67_NELNU|nr:TPA_asm: hypothetical protein HUJ06_024527 [Nelumbo nucifera]